MTAKSKRLGEVFDAHTAAEFQTRDIDATMATMGGAPHVTHVPTMTGGTASSTGVPCAVSTSTWRSLPTISSGLCILLPIPGPPQAKSDTLSRTTSVGADQLRRAQAAA